MNQGKAIAVGLAALLMTAGLYVADHRWIAPLMNRQARAKAAATSDEHPLAPEFTLTDISGQKLALADYKGKVVLLNFWATWCGPCRMEIPGLVELQNKYREQGFSVIGISLDHGYNATGKVQDFYKLLNMNYPVAIEQNRVSQLYGGVWALPVTWLIGRDGRLYAQHTGAVPASILEDEMKTLLAAKSTVEVTNFQRSDLAAVPGIDVSKLTAAQLAKFETLLKSKKCSCACAFNLLQCRREDSTCANSLKLARQQLEKFMKSLAQPRVAAWQGAPEDTLRTARRAGA